jgi:hypothetical protein
MESILDPCWVMGLRILTLDSIQECDVGNSSTVRWEGWFEKPRPKWRLRRLVVGKIGHDITPQRITRGQIWRERWWLFLRRESSEKLTLYWETIQLREFSKAALKLSEELSLVDGINWAGRFRGPEILLAKRSRDYWQVIGKLPRLRDILYSWYLIV